MSALRRYLGDSVYADFEGATLVLTTDNGHGPTNTICLEGEVYAALEEYVVRVLAAQAIQAVITAIKDNELDPRD